MENDFKHINHDVADLFPRLDDTSEILVTCTPDAYSAAVISRLVEECHARVLNLNVAGRLSDDGRMVVYLRIDRRDAATVARSIERYGYTADPIGAVADTADLEEARRRANEILRILDI